MIVMLVQREYFVYLLTNKSNQVIYTEVTNHLARRMEEHKAKRGSKFTSRYNVNKLVYYEMFLDIRKAIAREKQIKAGNRQKKLDLINSINPEWNDLTSKF